MGEPNLTEPIVRTKSKQRSKAKTRQLPPYHVILENDEDHTFGFVMEVLQKVLACQQEKAFQLTAEAHEKGRAIIWTGSKEVAELKVEQTLSFHEILPDGRKLGALGVYLEPAS